ncbi:MAG: thioredoxin-dependent thiol peroxidase [Deltaproteobacteria bacterium]
MVASGEHAPDFCLPNQDGQEVCLSSYRGKWVVLYFYPKDNTSGCTREACDFSDSIATFSGLDAVVLGVSPDSVKSHANFAKRHDLKVLLLSDPDKKVLESYGVWREKKMYGRAYMGVVRSTFLIDPEGRVAHVWDGVKVPGHVDAVRARLAELRGSRT